MEIALVDERLDSREFPSERDCPVSKSLNPREQISSHLYILSPSPRQNSRLRSAENEYAMHACNSRHARQIFTPVPRSFI